MRVSALFLPVLATTALCPSILLAHGTAPPAAPPAVTAPPPTKAENDRLALILRLPPANAAGFVGDPYPFDTCFVTGEPLGDHPVVLVLKDQRDALQEGRQLKFASEEAKTKFLADQRDYLLKLDRMIVSKFAASYPLDRDVVEIDRIIEERDEFVFGNRCYVVGRMKNIDNFVKQSGRYVKTYDKLITTKQRGHYPLDTSLVSGEKLPEKPYDLVIGARLIRLVDEAEAKQLLENPLPYLAKLPPLKGDAGAPPNERAKEAETKKEEAGRPSTPPARPEGGREGGREGRPGETTR
ncbi:MAG: hypothetical protein JNL80_13380 [Phycisphaerae bacterium]|jgi:hypothetical protein|nr:hypothetical protein [Phycisphaerae bacterium]